MKFEFVLPAKRAFESLTDEGQTQISALIDRLTETQTVASDTELPTTPLGPTWRHRAGNYRVLIAHTPGDETAWILGFGLRPAA